MPPLIKKNEKCIPYINNYKMIKKLCKYDHKS